MVQRTGEEKRPEITPGKVFIAAMKPLDTVLVAEPTQFRDERRKAPRKPASSMSDQALFDGQHYKGCKTVCVSVCLSAFIFHLRNY
jgi:hypothetical protein